MAHYVFKENSERNANTEIKLLAWNSKYDLLALADFKGDVCLQRIFWRKAWDYVNPYGSPSSSENQNPYPIKVSNLCWSPRGDCLCVCYTNSRVHFLEIENGTLVHEIRLKNGESSRQNFEMLVKWRQSEELDVKNRLNFPDLILETKILHKSGTGESIFKSNKVLATFDSIFLNKDYANYLTMLILTRGSLVDLYLNGYLHVHTLNLHYDQILDLHLTPNFNDFLFLSKTDQNLNCHRINLRKFNRRIADVQSFVERLGKSMTSSENVKICLKSILDSFDDILKDLTSKFRRFARDKFLVDQDSTIGHEFIHVLAFGTFSPELQTFLTQDLSDKNLKKLSLSLETTYANLRKSISSTLISSLSNLFYHLNELKEFSHPNFPLLDETSLKSTLNYCRNAILKSTQTLNVLDSSLEDFRLFSSWLRKICHLVAEDDRQHPTIKREQQNCGDQFSNNDLQRVLNFIRENFLVKYNGLDDCGENLFKIEKIGQYLEDGNLLTTSDMTDGKQSSTSLVRDIKNLNESFDRFLETVPETAAQSDWFEISKIQNWPLSNDNIDEARNLNVLIKFDSQYQIFRLFFYDGINRKIEIYEQQVQNKTKIAAQSPAIFFSKILDIAFPKNLALIGGLYDYNADSTCFLISEELESGTKMIKYKIAIMHDKIFGQYCNQIVDLEKNENIKTQSLKNGPYCQWSVCGSRKIACILHCCRTRLKLLEMEPDDLSMSSFELMDQQEAMSFQ